MANLQGVNISGPAYISNPSTSTYNVLWTTITPQNGWTSFSSDPYSTSNSALWNSGANVAPRYAKIDGTVFVEGMIQYLSSQNPSTPPFSDVFTLPSGYRPQHQDGSGGTSITVYPIVSGGPINSNPIRYRWRVQSNGIVRPDEISGSTPNDYGCPHPADQPMCLNFSFWAGE